MRNALLKTGLPLFMLSVLVPWKAADAAMIVFSDGFEGASLDPFWSTTLISGSLTMPSTAQVHSGSQSIRFNTTSTGVNKYVFLEHHFAEQVSGKLSVWVYDTGANISSSNALSITLADTALNRGAYINTFDYDLGPGNGGDYVVGTYTIGNVFSGIDRTQGWHQWTIENSPSLLKFVVDGQTVYSSATEGFTFNYLSLAMYAPGFRPSFTSHWDDVSFNGSTASAVPEPGSLTLFGTGLLVIFGMTAFSQWKSAAADSSTTVRPTEDCKTTPLTSIDAIVSADGLASSHHIFANGTRGIMSRSTYSSGYLFYILKETSRSALGGVRRVVQKRTRSYQSSRGIIGALFLGSIFSVAHQANAEWVSRTVQNVFGNFYNVQPRETIGPSGEISDLSSYIVGEGTNDVRWGDPLPNSRNSSLRFIEDAGFLGNQVVFPGQSFYAGSIDFENGNLSTTSSTAEVTVDLEVVVFGSEFLIDNHSLGLFDTWGITVVQTPNFGVDPVADADYMYFSDFPSLGRFYVYEDRVASVDIFARFGSIDPAGFGQVVGDGVVIRDEPKPVPEPSTLTLVGTCVATLLVARRQRRRIIRESRTA